ncbi:MAG TPA: 4-alpha-glucanotransferase [Rhizomicrobium sp.]|nr:4-alpha-glucanotransferase [Rhizomicrobium sp.]
MSRALELLARKTGLAVHWTDADGNPRRVSTDVLQAALTALDLPAGTESQIKDSLARLRKQQSATPALTIMKPGAVIESVARGARLVSEDGEICDAPVRNGRSCAPQRPGYYRLADEDRTIAVIPPCAFRVPKRGWGIAVQLYALRGSRGFGDFAALAAFGDQAAAAGADAVAISPVHALFGAAPDHISPYSPSSRLFLNPLYAPAGTGTHASDAALVDWPKAGAAKHRALHHAFQIFRQRPREPSFTAFVRQGGERLLSHARFELLDARFRARGFGSWEKWPDKYRRPDTAAVTAMKSSDPEIEFQLFLQWRADHALAHAQRRCRDAGMRIGLITDMAVGMDPAGSHAWSAPGEVLHRLSIGAPPDLYNEAGQNWGLTNFSPHGLIAGGYEGFIATLRAAMRHASGVRLDHAMGLMRLWVIPHGARPVDGVYLHYPFEQMLGLLVLESLRNRALVIAEDLGTVPRGFRATIARSGLLGMRVLWFERDGSGGFLAPSRWDRDGAALSTTHDLPTLAGWWRGHDIAWRRRLGLGGKATEAARKTRARDRRALWTMLRKAGCAEGRMPGETEPSRFTDAAITALARTSCPLALVPVEDFIGEAEQPNIPGTLDEHPNWRRRLKSTRPLSSPTARRRAAILEAERP